MNSDHADAVAHLCMYHGRLSCLPSWSSMESITSTTMLLQYTNNNDTASSHISTIQVSFDPPLKSTMDVRKRLVAMSRESEERNRQFYKQACKES